MQTRSSASDSFEFCFPRLDTLLLVEERAGAVVIRATRDSFTDQRKRAFVRELAAEGFIPEGCRWFGLAEPGAFMGIRWVVDPSWLQLSEAARVGTDRFMHRLFAGTGMLWGVLFVLLLARRFG